MGAASWAAALAAIAMAGVLFARWRQRVGAPAASPDTTTPDAPAVPAAAVPPPATAPARAEAPPAPPSTWGVRLEGPAHGGPMCLQARGAVGKCFRNEERPPLPLSECTLPHDCACRYVKLPERRKAERRSGHERRESTRYDPTGQSDRRHGTDRRRRSVNWNH
ncbi:MAG: hypothetical protein U1F10_11690 [Burkholderiales bacterium]